MNEEDIFLSMSKKNRRGKSRLLDELDLLSGGAGGGSGEVSDDDKMGGGGMKVKKSRRAKGKGKENLNGSGSGKTSGVTTPALKEEVDDATVVVEGTEPSEEQATAPTKGKKVIVVEAVLEEEMSKKDKRRLKELGKELSSKNGGPVDDLVRLLLLLS